MPTADQCRARAEETERLARLVSYERDRTRLLRQAQDWRDRADALDAARPVVESEPRAAVVGKIRRWLGLR